VTATPGWKLVSGSAHLVLDRPPVNAVPTLLSMIEDDSHRQYTAPFYAMRNAGGRCLAGGATGHLEAIETWDGG
jgi:hypothetical protein